MTTYLGYARVSTDDQNPELQVDALTAAGCQRVFTDHISGTRERRPELDRLLDQLREGDVLVVWRLDRLGRSMKHLITLVDDLAARGVGLRSLSESLDTTTANGQLMFHIFGALAAFERNLTVERTHAGLQAARSRGRVGGRPKALSPSQARTARSLYGAGDHTVGEIAATLNVSTATIYRAVRVSA